jgi:hypothetical protein
MSLSTNTTASLAEQFRELLKRGAQELLVDNPHRMACADVFLTPHTISEDDVRLFFLGLEHGTVTLSRGARFNTLDRPRAGGRWGLLSREKTGCRYNAEYLSQIAAYVHAILELGYPSERVLFELPHFALKLDLAILNDYGTVVVLGEAKRTVSRLARILAEVQARYSDADPGEQGRNEARQLAWRLWQTKASHF